MKDTIYCRRSCRAFAPEPVCGETRRRIEAFGKELRPLYPQIGVSWQIVPAEKVRFLMPWRSPQVLAVCSEVKPGYLENVGFMFQQMDLYLQSIGLGVCWVGLGKPRGQLEIPEGMEFVIFLAFGTPREPLSREKRRFSRKPMEEISDQADVRLECARVAPSSTNSQPWYFVHDGETVHACRSQAGLLRHPMLGTMNRIDMGIALAHLYVENPGSFRFFRAEPYTPPKGYDYTGSFTI